MSGHKVIFSLLSTNAALIAQVPAARIQAGPLPQGTTLPAIAINEVSRTERHAVAAAGNTMVTSRIQVTVMAREYDEQKTILDLVGAAVVCQRGTVNGVNVSSILREGVGPDFKADEPKIFMQTRDFIVKLIETH
jgi:hypothetical protein